MIVVVRQSEPPHKWRAEGKIFAVQEISINSGGRISFRIEDPTDNTPALVEHDRFTVTDGSIPDSWGVNEYTAGGYTVGPTAWHETGFWERWMDHDPDARSTYQEFRSELE